MCVCRTAAQNASGTYPAVVGLIEDINTFQGTKLSCFTSDFIGCMDNKASAN